ncbi:hypothetical protein N7501_010072 [Penicillium viridicatum]|nr:hypothetical protein N7501_010072 [Penicillium viridicatum]
MRVLLLVTQASWGRESGTVGRGRPAYPGPQKAVGSGHQPNKSEFEVKGHSKWRFLPRRCESALTTIIFNIWDGSNVLGAG